ncbi:hypothetical protein EI534_06850 [Pseudomonas frederiksbergensis]|nr:hypothetical protein [Pseudomonas frederiksbergensis]
MGAGLLAKTECQLTSSLPDTPPSRASQLPHFAGKRGSYRSQNKKARQGVNLGGLFCTWAV